MDRRRQPTRRAHPVRRGRGVPRPLAALALLLFALGHLLGLAHVALASHQLCPEHGRLEHVAFAASDAAPHDGPSWQEGATGGDHADCFVLLAREESHAALAAPAPAPSAATPTAALPDARAADVDPPAPVPLLFLAPKTSPPRA